MLEINNLHVLADGKKILDGVDLKILEKEAHVLVGKNGSGKSTLAHSIMGNPPYKISEGQISFNNEEISKLKTNEISQMGIFLSFQNPVEIPGVNYFSFLRTIYNKSHNEKVSIPSFKKILEEKMKLIGVKKEFLERSVNEGFSGGEKKKMEMLQMLVIEPKLAILDEIDSGLDADSLKHVETAVRYLSEKKRTSFLLITHNTRILKYISPNFVHVMEKGKIIKSGKEEILKEIEERGFKSYE